MIHNLRDSYRAIVLNFFTDLYFDSVLDIKYGFLLYYIYNKYICEIENVYVY